MSSTLQQFAKVIDEVRENINTPEFCLLLSGKLVCHGSFYLSWFVEISLRINKASVNIWDYTTLLSVFVRRRVRNTVFIFYGCWTYCQDFLFLSLSSWVPVMLSYPPNLQMPWCFPSLSLKRETSKVGNTHTLTHIFQQFHISGLRSNACFCNTVFVNTVFNC